MKGSSHTCFSRATCNQSIGNKAGNDENNENGNVRQCCEHAAVFDVKAETLANVGGRQRQTGVKAPIDSEMTQCHRVERLVGEDLCPRRRRLFDNSTRTVRLTAAVTLTCRRRVSAVGRTSVEKASEFRRRDCRMLRRSAAHNPVPECRPNQREHTKHVERCGPPTEPRSARQKARDRKRNNRSKVRSGVCNRRQSRVFTANSSPM